MSSFGLSRHHSRDTRQRSRRRQYLHDKDEDYDDGWMMMLLRSLWRRSLLSWSWRCFDVQIYPFIYLYIYRDTLDFRGIPKWVLFLVYCHRSTRHRITYAMSVALVHAFHSLTREAFIPTHAHALSGFAITCALRYRGWSCLNMDPRASFSLSTDGYKHIARSKAAYLSIITIRMTVDSRSISLYIDIYVVVVEWYKRNEKYRYTQDHIAAFTKNGPEVVVGRRKICPGSTKWTRAKRTIDACPAICTCTSISKSPPPRPSATVEAGAWISKWEKNRENWIDQCSHRFVMPQVPWPLQFTSTRRQKCMCIVINNNLYRYVYIYS